jgi:VanZ family protein
MVTWGPAVVFALTIFVLSSVPGDTYPQTDVPAADKIVHVLLYGMLGALCARALVLERRWGRLPAIVVAATALAVMYGMTDELHQLFVRNRSSDWRDVVADGIGGLLGGTAGALFWRRRRTGLH